MSVVQSYRNRRMVQIVTMTIHVSIPACCSRPITYPAQAATEYR